MFFYRDPEEVEKVEEVKAAAIEGADGGAVAAEWDPATGGATVAVAADNIDWAAEPAHTSDWAAEPAGGASGWDAAAGGCYAELAMRQRVDLDSSSTTRSMSGQEEETQKNQNVKYARTGIDHNRLQLEKLMKNPSKPVVLPPPPKEKTIRPPREMVKNVQGSSAGAGSGEFHVYKASRRREYERLKMMEEQKAKETTETENERRRREREEAAEAKTAKNRAKRQKKKEARIKGKQKKETNATDKQAASEDSSESDDGRPGEDQPFKKRRIVAAAPILPQDHEKAEETGNNAQPIDGSPLPIASANVVIHDED
ncbi:hypothetical protein FRC17_008605 [Serendipita sp. 399]|nr:hypothetical protein FRC17_008605 [Serendipita sp. 399]